MSRRYVYLPLGFEVLMCTARQLLHKRASSHSMKMHATCGAVSRLYFRTTSLLDLQAVHDFPLVHQLRRLDDKLASTISFRTYSQKFWCCAMHINYIV